MKIEMNYDSADEWVILIRQMLAQKDKDTLQEVVTLLVDHLLKKYEIYTICGDERNDVAKRMVLFNETGYIPRGKAVIDMEVCKITGTYYKKHLSNRVIMDIAGETFILRENFENLKKTRWDETVLETLNMNYAVVEIHNKRTRMRELAKEKIERGEVENKTTTTEENTNADQC